MMIYTSTNISAHYSWALDSANGDYIVENGNPKASINLDVPIYIRLRAHRSQWMYAPNNRWGSKLFQQEKHFTVKGGSNLISNCNSALKPLIDDNRMLQMDIETKQSTRYGEVLQITYTDKSGTQNEFTLLPIG